LLASVFFFARSFNYWLMCFCFLVSLYFTSYGLRVIWIWISIFYIFEIIGKLKFYEYESGYLFWRYSIVDSLGRFEFGYQYSIFEIIGKLKFYEDESGYLFWRYSIVKSYLGFHLRISSVYLKCPKWVGYKTTFKWLCFEPQLMHHLIAKCLVWATFKYLLGNRNV